MTDKMAGEPGDASEEIEDITIGEKEGQPHAYDALGEIDRIYDAFVSAMNEIESRATTQDSVIPLKPQERTRLLEFYTVVHAHLERLTSIIIFEKIGDKKGRDRRNSIEFFQGLSQSRREDLLYHIGVIDAGLKGELSKVRNARNQLVHEQAKRMYINLDNKSRSDVDRARNTVDKLEEIQDRVSED